MYVYILYIDIIYIYIYINYTKLYKGICEVTFKKCYANHKKSFNVPTYTNNTKIQADIGPCV